MSMNRYEFIRGDAVDPVFQLETWNRSEVITAKATHHDGSSHGRRSSSSSSSTSCVTASEGSQILRFDHNLPDPMRAVDISWLKSAAEVYHISPDIRDYVVVGMPIISTDIPNRNGQGFGLKDLLAFDYEIGRPRYKGFVGRPTFYNHENSIIENAKGVNLDAVLLPLPEYGIYKVYVLSAFDRTKDRPLTDAILKQVYNKYSMGAVAEFFECGLCGGLQGPVITNPTCRCQGVKYNDLRTLGKVHGSKLQYLLAKNFQFKCNSVVADPADVGARAKPLYFSEER